MTGREVNYGGHWWTVTGERNGYLTIERRGRAITISAKLVGGGDTEGHLRERAVKRDKPVCPRCLTRHLSFEWCKR